ncbi:MAG: hypothetical protein L3K06_01280 [Thermoplasmata archaeon]|nr:hypothetical protein [Thermoplasmata archaeon]MCI4353982.1 hypothetical protein [Thermoplasmata archaeon]
MGTRERLRNLARRVSLASAAFLLADVIIGCTVFSIATLAILAGFGWGWIDLARVYSAHALSFGSDAQLRAASGLLLVCPTFAVLVGWIGIRSFELPRRLWRLAKAGSPAPHPIVDLPRATPNAARRIVPMADGALWAVRLRRRSEEFRFVSLLVSVR